MKTQRRGKSITIKFDNRRESIRFFRTVGMNNIVKALEAAEASAVCKTCSGDGLCRTCLGTGQFGGKSCRVCGGSGNCSKCYGMGETND
jgi:hypothetical protein